MAARVSKINANPQLGYDDNILFLKQTLATILRDHANNINGISDGSIDAYLNMTAAPTTMSWKQGDFIKNSAPTGASPTIGWICTVSGTPGTWVAVAVGGGGGVSDGDKGDITVSAAGATWTIDADAVTFAKMQNINTARLLGRGTAAVGDIEEITLGTNLSLTGTTLNAAGGASITATTVTLPYAARSTVTVTDATVTATSKILIGWGNSLDTDSNDCEMDDVTFKTKADAGSFALTVSSLRNIIGGVFKINYQVAA